MKATSKRLIVIIYGQSLTKYKPKVIWVGFFSKVQSKRFRCILPFNFNVKWMIVSSRLGTLQPCSSIIIVRRRILCFTMKTNASHIAAAEAVNQHFMVDLCAHHMHTQTHAHTIVVIVCCVWTCLQLHCMEQWFFVMNDNVRLHSKKKPFPRALYPSSPQYQITHHKQHTKMVFLVFVFGQHERFGLWQRMKQGAKKGY